MQRHQLLNQPAKSHLNFLHSHHCWQLDIEIQCILSQMSSKIKLYPISAKQTLFVPTFMEYSQRLTKVVLPKIPIHASYVCHSYVSSLMTTGTNVQFSRFSYYDFLNRTYHIYFPLILLNNSYPKYFKKLADLIVAQIPKLRKTRNPKKVPWLFHAQKLGNFPDLEGRILKRYKILEENQTNENKAKTKSSPF